MAPGRRRVARERLWWRKVRGGESAAVGRRRRVARAVVVAQAAGRRGGSWGAVAAFSSDRSAPNAHPLCSERSGPRWIAVIKAVILSTIARTTSRAPVRSIFSPCVLSVVGRDCQVAPSVSPPLAPQVPEVSSVSSSG